MPDAREIIAVSVVLGCFGLLGGFVFTGGHLDTGTGVAIVGFSASPLSLVLGFYFGKTNGAQSAMATASTILANQAIAAVAQRRTGDPPIAQAPVMVVSAPPGPTSPAP